MSGKKIINNILFGFATQFIIICLGIIVPRLVLTSYGSDVNGFTSTVTQLFTYMALLEAGIAQSTQNSLYKPIAQNDRYGISRIMVASQRYYRKVTLIYGAAVVVMSVLIPFAVKTNINKPTTIAYILITGISSVIGFYYLESWKQLLAADGRYYISQIIGMIVTIVSYAAKIIIVPFAINIVWIQCVQLLITVIQLIIYKCYLRKHYSWVDFNVEPDNTALKDRYAFMKNQIASTVFSSTDIIVLSVIGSTLLSSVYAIYSLVFYSLVKVIDAIYFGMVYILGQSWSKEKREYTYIHDMFDTLTHWGITSTMAVGYLLCLPFVSLYTTGVDDVNYFYKWLPLLFCLVQILSYNRYVNGNLTALAGYANKVSRFSMLEAVINVVLSLILGWKFGMYGVLVATVVALPVKVTYCLYLANRVILQRKIWNSLKIILVNYILFIMVIVFNECMTIEISNYWELIKYGLIVAPVVYVVFLGINLLVSMKTTRHSILKLKERFQVKQGR